MNNDLAYIAGFWEGEGYAGVHNGKDRQRLTVGITNTNRSVLLWIKEKFDTGYIKIKSRGKRANPNWKIVYDWIVRDGNAMNFLKMIYPYLRFRKEQVKSLIVG